MVLLGHVDGSLRMFGSASCEAICGHLFTDGTFVITSFHRVSKVLLLFREEVVRVFCIVFF